MNSVWPIIKKELRTFFNSPIAYITVLFFLVFTAAWTFLFQQFFVQDTASLRAFFAIVPVAFAVIVPAITMRLWAEERKMGTIELLITLPYSEWVLTIAKFLAAFILVAIMVVLTLPMPLMVGILGRLDPGQVATQYLGVLFMGGACVAVGTYLSSLTKNQISAFIVSVLILIVLSFAGQAAVWVPAMPKAMGALFRWISMINHFESFGKGVLDTRDVMYFVIVSALFVFLTAKTLLFRKWR
jgi:ABC-2 type transport system permease protein